MNEGSMNEEATGSRPQHWSQVRESGSYWGMAFTLWCYRVLGRRVLQVLLYPIIGYFFISNRQARMQSQRFLKRLYSYTQANNIDQAAKRPPTQTDSFFHLMNFGQSMVDRFGALVGEIKRDKLFFEHREELLRLAREGCGAVIMTSHLGSTEMMRSLLEQVPGVKMNVLVFTDHTARFNRLATNMAGASTIELIPIPSLDPGTAMLLKDKIDQGEFVVVASDRTSASSANRVTHSLFFGHKAPFPQGSFILGSLMECPVYLLFCVKEQNQHTVYFEKFADQIELPRKQRKERLQVYIDQYAQRLQYYCCKAPLQWFNFYDFWDDNRTQGE
jgi:predicted LPLAT superfamily acyltransferase